MLPLVPPLAFPFPAAYAETHYRFPYFFTLLSRPEPEIVVDAPHRIEPDARLPLAIIAKDAHVHPVRLERLTARVWVQPGTTRTVELLSAPVTLGEPWWWTVCEIDVGDLEGSINVDVEIVLSSRGETRSYRNDNYRTSSHAPLQVFRSGDRLPSLPGFVAGETHAHTMYTSDQVEFGAPVGATAVMARALGLGFACLTDHSYDLDDAADSYLRNDPGLPQWNAFLSDIAALNQSGVPPVLIGGEEVTCRNARGRNVHCLVYGDSNFHPGSGDGAERWLRTRSELDVHGLAARLPQHAGMFAAHVREPVPLLQRILLGRGAWTSKDLEHRRLDGIQFWNGSGVRGADAGKELWVRLLLSGRRTVAIAGNDAHGNFNRFRQVRIPFVLLHDVRRQLFGDVRTSVYAEAPSPSLVLSALRQGSSVLTDGPVGALYDTGGVQRLGTACRPGDRLVARAVSSSEYGKIRRAVVIAGTEQGSERIVMDDRTDSTSYVSPPFDVGPDDLYVRMEVETAASAMDGTGRRAITNPVWVQP